ncbi:MAG: hypothetical protein JWP12_329 [Bacteroidetes bacterium]|nr:hypothetical protein [Bacteroidota bacterium]
MEKLPKIKKFYGIRKLLHLWDVLYFNKSRSNPKKTYPMKPNPFLFKTLIAATVLLTACNGSFGPSAEEKSKDVLKETVDKEVSLASTTNGTFSVNKVIAGTAAPVMDEAEKSNGNAPATEQQPVLQSSAATEKIPEKIKKTADIDLTVDDYKAAREAIGKIIASGHGYIGGENEQNSTYNITNRMLIRVTNKDFDAMVGNLSGIAAHVNSKNIYTEDVTAQFVDLTARLKSKKEVENRYLDLLKKAGKVDEILEVEEQLRVIQEEIESKEGELKYLKDQVDYSTINLNFHQDFEYKPADSPGFFGRIGNAFGNGWNGFLSFLVGLVYAWPMVLVLVIGGWFLYRFIRKQVKK